MQLRIFLLCVPAADLDKVHHSALSQPFHLLQAFFLLQPLLTHVVSRVELDGEAERRRQDLADLHDESAQERHALLGRAAVFVRPAVGMWAEKFGQQEAMRAWR